MKANVLYFSPNPVDESALRTVALIAGAAARKVRHREEARSLRIGVDPAGSERPAWWEQLAFITLWLCGLFSVGYCVKTVLSLAWPG